MIAKDGLFTPDEVRVALELVDGALADPAGDYRVIVATIEDRLAGYVCFGPTPMTHGTWDLYWIVSDPDRRGQGVASALLVEMERQLAAAGARLVRVETSARELYGAAQRFYQRHRYPEAARIDDFYDVGDHLITMIKRLAE
jgi:ribosomal protein S18 acetylase RimI-like enzyme